MENPNERFVKIIDTELKEIRVSLFDLGNRLKKIEKKEILIQPKNDTIEVVFKENFGVNKELEKQRFEYLSTHIKELIKEFEIKKIAFFYEE